MEFASPTIRARHVVNEMLAELGQTDPGACCEMVIVRDGYCVGRRFTFDRFQAVWLEADATIELRDGNGALLREFSMAEERELRRAA